MRRFIWRILFFTILVFGLAILVLEWIECTIERNTNFKMETTSKYLILGASHPAYAFNDSLIKDLRNFGRSAESYFYMYFKGRELLRHNKSVEIVMIEFPNILINRHLDSWIWDENIVNNRYTLYSPSKYMTKI